MRSEHFAPFMPGQDAPWDARSAAHLLRRAGFGAAHQEVQQAVEQGLEASVDRLFDEAEDQEAEFQGTFNKINDGLINFADPGQLQAWWCYRMARTRVPLREKLTLFWHGHFATSFYKVEDSYLMHRQIETLRQHAWGNFRDLVLAVAKDPAMLVYLDGETNTKEHPNENFARELMELFTCGIGNYTEQDVQEAARAFTGWHRGGPAGDEFFFNAEAHDFGRKQFLGRSGKFDGTDVIDILMQHPATPRLIARKLLRFFAAAEPSEEVVAEAAAVFDRTQLNVKWFLRELLLSKYFYSADCIRKRISSPVEFVVGTRRTLGLRMNAYELKDNIAAAGQELLAPPNVKGWDGERKWINSTALGARANFAQFAAGVASSNEFGSHLDINQLVPPDMTDPAKRAARRQARGACPVPDFQRAGPAARVLPHGPRFPRRSVAHHPWIDAQFAGISDGLRLES
jgi:uncharacterized protein (DUF1800 family)